MTKLHHVKALQALMPRYCADFQCIGADCPDSCCSGWRVDIDKKTHLAYKAVTDKEIAPIIASSLKRTKGTNTKDQYSKINLIAETGDCPFLANSLCMVQKKLGEDKLSHTCFQFPRSTAEFGGIRQQSLTMACPQAATLALGAEDSMEFISAPITTRPDVVLKRSFGFGAQHDALNTVRFALIRLMRVKSIPLWQRLAALTAVCELVEKYLTNGSLSELTKIIEQFESNLSPQSIETTLADQVPDAHAQSIVLIGVWKTKFFYGSSKVQQLVQDQVMQGLGFKSDSGEIRTAEIIDRYTEGMQLLTQTLDDSQSLLNNFILNEMFREIFPFAFPRPMQHLRLLIVKYGVVRLMLAARCRYHQRPIRKDEAIETIHVFSRLYEHSSDLGQSIDKVLDLTALHTTADLYKFLKPAY